MSEVLASPMGIIALALMVLLILFLILVIWVYVVDRRVRGVIDGLEADRRMVSEMQVMMVRMHRADVPQRGRQRQVQASFQEQPPTQTPVPGRAPRGAQPQAQGPLESETRRQVQEQEEQPQVRQQVRQQRQEQGRVQPLGQEQMRRQPRPQGQGRSQVQSQGQLQPGFAIPQTRSAAWRGRNAAGHVPEPYENVLYGASGRQAADPRTQGRMIQQGRVSDHQLVARQQPIPTQGVEQGTAPISASVSSSSSTYTPAQNLRQSSAQGKKVRRGRGNHARSQEVAPERSSQGRSRDARGSRSRSRYTEIPDSIDSRF